MMTQENIKERLTKALQNLDQDEATSLLSSYPAEQAKKIAEKANEVINNQISTTVSAKDRRFYRAEKAVLSMALKMAQDPNFKIS